MVGRQGKDSVRRGKDNRNIILTKLMEGSLHYSGLKRELDMSNVTLSKHLKALLDEGILKRQVEGRKIVYVVVDQKQTVLDMRKECQNELALLMFDYGICLTKEVKGKLKVAFEALKESIKERKQDVDVAARMMGVPQEDLDKLYVGRLPIRYKSEGEK